MNKLHAHGGLSKPPSVNQLVGQQPQQHQTAPTSIAHMGECVIQKQIRCTDQKVRKVLIPREPVYAVIVQFFVATLLLIILFITHPFFTGSNMLNSHHMQANGDMNGGHSSHTLVSASHCSPPPPYNPDPGLVRYLTLQWHSFFVLL